MTDLDAVRKKGIYAFPKEHLLVITILLLSGLGMIVISGNNEAAVQAATSTLQQIPVEKSIQSTSESKKERQNTNIAQDNKEEGSSLTPTSISTHAKPTKEIIIPVTSGDSLSSIFQRAGLNDALLYKVIHSSNEAKQLSKIFPGESFTFSLSSDGTDLLKLSHKKNRLEYSEIEKKGTNFEFRHIIIEPDLLYNFAQGTIENSLFLSALNAGLSNNLTMELANIFAWDIDFIQDIREGDQFAVVYEEHYLNGEKIGNGDIVAATFTNQGKQYSAVKYKQANGVSGYFTPDGKSMRKAFLRSPVDFARISSHFNLKRKHPVLHTIRAHKGTDYAAARGTPVRATGDGKVIHASKKGGYGNAVIIQHGQSYQTLYAHLDKYKKGIKLGSTVHQGDIIGYVGSTGLATGPHLHYEFHVNGSVRNPVTVKLPDAEPISKTEMHAFTEKTTVQMARLANFQAANITQVVMAE